MNSLIEIVGSGFSGSIFDDDVISELRPAQGLENAVIFPELRELNFF
jgi:hypothetical protein